MNILFIIGGAIVGFLGSFLLEKLPKKCRHSKWTRWEISKYADTGSGFQFRICYTCGYIKIKDLC